MLGPELCGLGDERERWLRELYAQQFERMVRFARRALPPDDRAEAEDVVQAVFTEAIVTCVQRSWVVPGEGWLMRRLRSRIADRYRRRGRQRRLLEAVVAIGRPPSVEEIVTDRATVEELLTTIPDARDRLTLCLRLYGYREAEIAALLSVPYEGRQVRDRLQRVRRQVGAWRAADRRAAEA